MTDVERLEFSRHKSREEGRAEGEALGLEKGREEGREEGGLAKALEVAKELMAMGLPLDQIIQATKLTKEQLTAL